MKKENGLLKIYKKTLTRDKIRKFSVTNNKDFRKRLNKFS